MFRKLWILSYTIQSTESHQHIKQFKLLVNIQHLIDVKTTVIIHHCTDIYLNTIFLKVSFGMERTHLQLKVLKYYSLTHTIYLFLVCQQVTRKKDKILMSLQKYVSCKNHSLGFISWNNKEWIFVFVIFCTNASKDQ